MSWTILSSILIFFSAFTLGVFADLYHFRGRWPYELPVSPADYACVDPWMGAWVWSCLWLYSMVVLLNVSSSQRWIFSSPACYGSIQTLSFRYLIFWKIVCFCLHAMMQLPHMDGQLATSDLISLYYLPQIKIGSVRTNPTETQTVPLTFHPRPLSIHGSVRVDTSTTSKQCTERRNT